MDIPVVVKAILTLAIVMLVMASTIYNLDVTDTFVNLRRVSASIGGGMLGLGLVLCLWLEWEE